MRTVYVQKTPVNERWPSFCATRSSAIEKSYHDSIAAIHFAKNQLTDNFIIKREENVGGEIKFVIWIQWSSRNKRKVQFFLSRNYCTDILLRKSREHRFPV